MKGEGTALSAVIRRADKKKLSDLGSLHMIKLVKFGRTFRNGVEVVTKADEQLAMVTLHNSTCIPAFTQSRMPSIDEWMLRFQGYKQDYTPVLVEVSYNDLPRIVGDDDILAINPWSTLFYTDRSMSDVQLTLRELFSGPATVEAVEWGN